MVASLKIDVPRWALEYDKKATRQIMRSAGNEVAALARSIIRHAKGSGRVYDGVAASAPGEAPVSRSGELAASIKVKIIRGGMGVSVRDAVHYALSLEAGAHGGGGNTTASNLRKAGSVARGRYGSTLGANRQIAKSNTRVLLPRPFLSTALEQRENSIAERIRASVVEGIKFNRINP